MLSLDFGVCRSVVFNTQMTGRQNLSEPAAVGMIPVLPKTPNTGS